MPHAFTCLDIPAPTDGAAEGVWTRDELVANLRALGVTPGQTLLVHASLREIGWVVGGARTVVEALREALGSAGTLVAGTGTAENSMTSRAYRARIAGLSPAQAVGFRNRMKPFDPDTTPTTAGAVAEALRTTPGAVRSGHPQSSFAAIGRQAASLMAGHLVNCHLGEDSPLGKLYQQSASVLMLGVGYMSCSALHLAEYRYAERPPLRTYACVVATGGKRHWRTYQDVVLDDREFETIGECLDKEIDMRRSHVGYAECRLMPIRPVVDFATQWLKQHRR